MGEGVDHSVQPPGLRRGKIAWYKGLLYLSMENLYFVLEERFTYLSDAIAYAKAHTVDEVRHLVFDDDIVIVDEVISVDE